MRKGSRTDLLMSCWRTALRTALRTAGHLLELEATRMTGAKKMHMHRTNGRRKIKQRKREGAGKNANRHLLEGGKRDIRSCEKSSNRPGRLVTKIQSVTLKPGLSLAVNL